jgi:hypothetical protein
MLTRLAGDTSFSYLLVSYVALETGTGLVNPAITNNAVSGMPQSQAGSPRLSRRGAGRPAPRSAQRRLRSCPAVSATEGGGHGGVGVTSW